MRYLVEYLQAHGLPHLVGPDFFLAHGWLTLLLAALVAWVVPVLLLVLPLAGFSTYVERKLAAAIQRRYGPVQAGPWGLLQFMLDGVKLLMKEDLTPQFADRPLFKLAPYIVCAGAFTALVTLAWSSGLYVVDLNVGVFFVMAATSTVAIGILLAGWGSNNKWALFGGMRAAAQIVSYEVPAALCLMTPILLAGTLQMGEIVGERQGDWLYNWYIFGGPQHGFQYGLAAKLAWHLAFAAPLALAAAAYFFGSLAETNRTPFDLPEAENELVAGYHTEYTGLRFGFFFVAEYVDMFIVCALLSTLWLGGYRSGLPPLDFFVRAALDHFTELGLLARFSALAGLCLSVTVLAGSVLLRMYRRPRARRLVRPALVLAGAGGVVGALLVALGAGADAGRFGELGFGLYQVGIFLSKTYLLVLAMMWIRWTWPRFRIDQMMRLCWKRLVPLAFACLLATGTLMVLRAEWAPPAPAAPAAAATTTVPGPTERKAP